VEKKLPAFVVRCHWCEHDLRTPSLAFPALFIARPARSTRDSVSHKRLGFCLDAWPCKNAEGEGGVPLSFIPYIYPAMTATNESGNEEAPTMMAEVLKRPGIV
jgi:hypothetical protein